MIPEWETNYLFLSDRLEKHFPTLFANLCSLLNCVSIEIIPDTSDIWCRDYMPIQIEEGLFCRFVYSPDYLLGHEHLITPAEKCRLSFMEDYRQEEIILDGGNVVASRTKVILTDKVYAENPSITRRRLADRLAQIFQAECIFIPRQAGDDVGHSDGVVRFVAENRVLINDYSGVDPTYGAKVRKMLETHGLEVETLPMFEEKRRRRRDDLLSAVGIYINYLRIGDLVVIPAYERPEDGAALEKVRHAMPDARVFQVSCRKLAEKGGVLNCISWAIKAEKARMT
jgi:agmatine deiminase